MIDDKQIATRQSYGEKLEQLGHKYNNIIVLDADLSTATKTEIFAKSFPERFFDMGIAEQDMMSTAAGMATCGKTVFASTFAVFAAGRSYDQIRNSICYPNLNVKICATHARNHCRTRWCNTPNVRRYKYNENTSKYESIINIR